HLVRVHVRRGPRTGLENVDRKLVVQFARGDAVSRGRDPFGLVRIEQPELRVYPGCGRFDPAQPAGDGRRDRLTRHLKVLYCFARLASPELLLRFYLGHAVESRKKRRPAGGGPPLVRSKRRLSLRAGRRRLPSACTARTG